LSLSLIIYAMLSDVNPHYLYLRASLDLILCSSADASGKECINKMHLNIGNSTCVVQLCWLAWTWFEVQMQTDFAFTYI